MKKDFIREYFSVPNLLGYLRLILIPVYLYVYLHATTTSDYYIATGIMAVSFLSDLFDGKIARRFNMVTEFGKILDPIADKITQGVLALSFASRYPAMLCLLIVFVIKELIMGILGLFMMRKHYRMDGAQMHGKICTTILDVTMFILLLIPAIPEYIVWGLSILCILSICISFGIYLHMYYTVWETKLQGK